MINKVGLGGDIKVVFLSIFYFVNLCFFYGVIIWQHSQLLLQLCHGYWSCNRFLSFQWFGWEVDLGDSQWKSFHDNFLLLASVLLGLSGLSAAIRAFAPKLSLGWLRLLTGIIILLVQHGFHSLIILILAGLGFACAHICAGTFVGPYAIWGYGFFILAFKESYRLMHHHSSWKFLQIFFDRKYGGMHGWQFAANFLILRVISFGIDLHLIRNATMNKKKIDDQLENSNKEKVLMISSTALDDYTITNMITYVVYAPLYLAGPIISFQDFMQYDKKSQTEVSILKYSLRFISLFLLMEWCTSRYPVFAISNSGLLPHMRVSDIAITFYIILKVMWLKFTTLWRFFRLWALADGVYVEENMQRCMSNNYSLEQFWRGWHASFNKWIVRYIYLPWGGRSYRWVSVWFIFLFVALWHDIEWKLIVWGLMNGSFYVLESAIKGWYTKLVTIGNQNDGIRKLKIPEILDHLISSVSGAVYVMVLIVINLVGYALGTGTFQLLQQKIFTWEGFVTFLGSLYFLSVGVSIMLTLRKYKLCAQ